jgi:ABC-type transporter MlaC component
VPTQLVTESALAQEPVFQWTILFSQSVADLSSLVATIQNTIENQQQTHDVLAKALSRMDQTQQNIPIAIHEFGQTLTSIHSDRLEELATVTGSLQQIVAQLVSDVSEQQKHHLISVFSELMEKQNTQLAKVLSEVLEKQNNHFASMTESVIELVRLSRRDRSLAERMRARRQEPGVEDPFARRLRTRKVNNP